METNNETIFQKLFSVIETRKKSSSRDSYTASLMEKGALAINEKIQEEAAEVCVAGLAAGKAHLVHEIADLFFHTLVLASHKNISLRDIEEELEGRFGKSGLVEKAERRKREEEKD